MTVLSHKLGKLKSVIVTVFVRSPEGSVSVPRRDINANAQTVLTAGIGKFSNHIPLVRTVPNAMLGVRRIPKTKTVVMLCGNYSKLKSCLRRRPYPLTAVKLSGSEQMLSLFTVSPFLVGKGVHSKMKKSLLFEIPNVSELSLVRHGTVRLYTVKIKFFVHILFTPC
jgi:hypothetical protein